MVKTCGTFQAGGLCTQHKYTATTSYPYALAKSHGGNLIYRKGFLFSHMFLFLVTKACLKNTPYTLALTLMERICLPN